MTLPLCTLRNFPQHAAAPQPPALLHTDSLGETDTEKEKGGEKRGGGGCYLVALSQCYLSSPFHCRFTTEGTAEYIRIHTLPLSLHHTHTLNIFTSLIQNREEGGNRGWTKAMRCDQGLNEVWKTVVKALWTIATGIQTHSMPIGTQELRTKEYKLAEMYTLGETIWCQILQGRESQSSELFVVETQKENVIVDPFWLSNSTPNLSYMWVKVCSDLVWKAVHKKLQGWGLQSCYYCTFVFLSIAKMLKNQCREMIGLIMLHLVLPYTLCTSPISLLL